MQRQKQTLTVADFSLDHTLDSGQAFRWKRGVDGSWIGVVGRQSVRLRQDNDRIEIEADDIATIAGYFQWHVQLREIVAAFPKDEHLDAAVASCWGLRILKQEPWECLASFIASSTKQIVQIKQIVENLARNCGKALSTQHSAISYSFPSVEVVAASTHDVLWNCKLGFRAKYLLGSARRIAEGKLDLQKIDTMRCDEAREYLCQLSGVGEKIANCVLLFAYGKLDAFPIDVWVERGLREMYFRGKRKVTPRRLREFARTYFGPHAGYAQQYLFHYVRTRRNPGRLSRLSALAGG
jgi:N-glycosylase/DNA lyase